MSKCKVAFVCNRCLLVVAAAFAVSVALSPFDARADALVVPNGGRVDLGPGWRFEPLRGSHSFGGAGRFSWQADERWFIGIEIGGWTGEVDPESLGLTDATAVSSLRVFVGDVRVAGGVHLLRIGPVWLYGVGGGGYHLMGVTSDRAYKEGATQGLFLGAGALAPLTDRVGLFLEDRWTFFSRIEAEVGGERRTLDAGGNLLWGGVFIVFPPEPRPWQTESRGSHDRAR